MNEGSDKQFQNRWDFRRREEDADSSSDDSRSKSGTEAKDRNCKVFSNLAVNLAVPENVEVLAELDHNQDVHVLSERNAKKRVKPTKRKKNPQLEKTKKSPIEEKKTRRKTKKNPVVEKKTRRRNTNGKEKKMSEDLKNSKKMSEDLKNFTNSLVQELKVARENMFAQMKKEMRKMLACRSSTGPRTNRFNGLMGGCHKSNVDLKTTKANGLSSVLRNESNPVVSSPHLTLPTVVTKPQLQSNLVPLNDYICEETPKINAGLDMDIRKLMNSKNRGGFPAFQPTETQLGSCSLISCKHSGQNLSQTTSVGLGFPFPGLHQVMDKDSNMSSFTEDCRLGPKMNGNIVNFLEGKPAFSRMQFNKRP